MLLRTRQTIAPIGRRYAAIIAFGRPDLFIRINNRRCLVRTIRHFLSRHPTCSFLLPRRSIRRHFEFKTHRARARVRREIYRVTINSPRGTRQHRTSRELISTLRSVARCRHYFAKIHAALYGNNANGRDRTHSIFITRAHVSYFKYYSAWNQSIAHKIARCIYEYVNHFCVDVVYNKSI